MTSTDSGVEGFDAVEDLEALPLTGSAELDDVSSASHGTQSEPAMTDSNREGVRLEQFQMLNWGTFDRVVQRLRMFSGNALLTGQIGAGKSTVVDGLTTLFADTSRVTFNLAAGADRRERTLASYVLGTYGRTRDPETGADKPETLRNARTAYSVLLARFTGLGSDTGVLTAGVVFWFPENGTNPNKLYFTCKTHLDISDHLTGHRDHRAVRAALHDAGAELFENNFRKYQRNLCRDLNLTSNALKLLVQTISMKQVGNLTEFVREHMLDQTSAALDIAKILEHYSDLLRAHELVQEARRQLDKLEALRRDAETYDRALARIESTRAADDAVAREAEQLRARLLKAAFDEVRGTLPGLRADRDRLTDQVRQARARVTQNEIAIATHGGAVLKEAEHELELARSNRRAVAEATAEVQRLATLLDIAPLESVSDYPRFADALNRADAELAGGDAVMRDHAWETERAFREAASAVVRNRDEHKTAGTAASNVPREQRILRDRMCAELDLKVADLPYVAELLTINQEHDSHTYRTRSGEPYASTDWEPAAERLLRPFALSLLVAQRIYDRVSAWVDDNDLRGRLEYHPVPAGTPVPTPTDPRSIAAVIEVRPGTFATAWLTADINRRYDHIRVEAAPELRQHRRAVTPSGQIKEGTRHVKDDRRHLIGRANFVLGWNTAARREALESLLPDLEAAATEAKRTADASRVAQNHHGERVNAVRLLREKTTDLTHLDLGSAHDRVAAAEEMVASFTSDADLAHYLTVKLRLADELHDLDQRRSRAESDVGGAEKTESDHHDTLTEVRRRLEHLVGPDLDEHAAEALAEALEQVPPPRGLEAIGAWQRDVSGHLTDRATSAQATRERAGRELVGHMKDFTREWPLSVGEILTTDPASRTEFLAMRDRIARDDLPRFADEFRTELETNAIHHLARFSVGLEQDSRAIAERIDVINSALHGIDYRPETYICLERDPSPDSMVREFRAQLEAITGDTMLGDDETYAEIRFLRVKELLDRFAGRDGLSVADANWTAKVTDVRNWYEFSASERARVGDVEVEHYQDSGGKSGGQKEKLAYTVLAASLSYQYGLAGGRTDAFRFVMIDEAFGRGSEDSTRFGLELFDRLGLQLLTVTPLQKIHIIEQYVNALAYVRPVETRSQLISMPIQEYRARRRQGPQTAASGVEGAELGQSGQNTTGDWT